ncbi:MAG: molybdopterin-dependent oxidoreductase [Coriobacteriales bacterium]|jgi:molybdopterin-containing oxidoreductase family molybdopterin binding subunit|nr:molybdopterin-dependent oxidoreductase [Coriobacteriales bacterium]
MAEALSRRRFTALGLGAAAALATGTWAGANLGVFDRKAFAEGDAAAEGEALEQTYHSGCRGNCGSRCPMKVHVREGHVVKVEPATLPEGDTIYERFCVKGFTQPLRLYDPDRVKYPMLQVGGKGSGEWERISWEEAFDLIAEKINAAQASEYGPASIGFYSSYGSYGVLNGAMAGYLSFAYGRFMSAMGNTVLGAAADQAQIQEQMLNLGIYGSQPQDIVNSKTILCWGGNPAEAYVHDWKFVMMARDKGARIITIDPQYTASAIHSDLYLPIRPGTDGALMLAMANYYIDNDLINRSFMATTTVSPFLVKPDGSYFRASDTGVAPTEGPISATTGQPTVIDPIMVFDNAASGFVAQEVAQDPAVEGSFDHTAEDGATVRVQTCFEKVKGEIKEWTVARAAAECDLSEEQIVELAEIYADQSAPAAVLTFQGFGHHVNSHHNYKNLALIAALVGQAAKPGAMLTRGSAGSYSLDRAAYFMGYPPQTITGMYLPKVMKEGKWGDKPLKFEVVWFTNGNPLSCDSGRQELIEAVRQVDFVICSDVSFTDSAAYSDLVLPVPHAFETEDFDSNCPTAYPTYYHKVIDPLYECKADIDIMREVANRCGIEFAFAESNEEMMRKTMDTEANVAAGAGYDAFQKGELVKTPMAFPQMATDTFLASSIPGKLQFYLEKPVPRNNFGQSVAEYEKWPYYEHAYEAYKENPDMSTYPLMGCSQHDKYHVHSQLSYTAWIREIDPYPMLKINASDAAARGIGQNDVVRVYNSRGEAVLHAKVTEGIKPGVVSIPHGWQADQFIKGHTQDLTSIVMNDFVSNSAFYDFICEVERYNEGLADEQSDQYSALNGVAGALGSPYRTQVAVAGEGA